MSDEQLKLEAVRLLDIIVGEFNSDPHSVACFDLRIVKQSQKVANDARGSGLLTKAWKAHEAV